MTKTSLQQIIQALNDANVRYLVVGGLAVIAHGYVRLTLDVDLLIQFDDANIVAALKALATLGYAPTIPVTIEQFANPQMRQTWINEKQMKVLKLYSDAHRETSIDVFVSDPIGIDEALKRVQYLPLAESLQVPICGYDDLVNMKTQAGRPKDILDLQQLKKSRGET